MPTQSEQAIIDAARKLIDLVNRAESDNFSFHVMRQRRRGDFSRHRAMSTELADQLGDLEAALDGMTASPPSAGAPATISEEAPAQGDDDELSINDFIGSIATSLVDAQTNLDIQSADYLESIRGKAHITPAVFRIPKVTAQLKFAMKDVQSSGFNVIVASKRSEQEKLQEQTIDLEMVSTPPAVDVLKSAGHLGLAVDVVVLGPRDDAIRAALDEWQNTAGTVTARDEGLLDAFASARHNVITFTTPTTPDVWFVAQTGAETERKFGVWQLDMTAPTTLTSLLHRQLLPNTPLQRALNPIFDRQQQVLERHKALGQALLGPRTDEG